MNIKCIIAREVNQGKYQVCTCLRGGGPDEAGVILEKHFVEPTAVGELFSAGDIIQLHADGSIERYDVSCQLEEPEPVQLVDLEDVLQLAARNNGEYVYVMRGGAWEGMAVQ